MAKAKTARQVPTTTNPILSTKDLYVIGDRDGDPLDHPLHRRMHAPPTPEMIDSIEQDGVRTPIEVASILVLRDESGLVLPVMQEEGWEDLFIVVDGARRVDALREVNTRLAARGKPEMLVKTSVVEGGLPEALATRVISNGFYQCDPPSVRAALMAGLAARRILVTDIGRWFGLGEKMVRNYLKVNKAVAEVKAAVDAGQITLTQAIQWADMPADEQRAELTKTLTPPESKKSREEGGEGGEGGEGVKGSSTEPKKPSRKTIRSIIALEGADEVLPAGFLSALRWVDGAESADDIPGFRDILNKIAWKPAAKRGRKPKK